MQHSIAFIDGVQYGCVALAWSSDVSGMRLYVSIHLDSWPWKAIYIHTPWCKCCLLVIIMLILLQCIQYVNGRVPATELALFRCSLSVVMCLLAAWHLRIPMKLVRMKHWISLACIYLLTPAFTEGARERGGHLLQSSTHITVHTFMMPDLSKYCLLW